MPVFAFTDIENSTRLWEEFGEAMAAALQRHDAVQAELFPLFGGRLVKHRGDGVFAVFDGGRPAAWALELLRRMQGEQWGLVGEVRVRVALHAGEAEERGGDFFGPAVNRAARLCEAGWGGQILLTPQAAEAAELPAGAQLKDLGVHLLQDLGQPEKILQLCHADLAEEEFPPVRSLSRRPHNLPPQPTPFVGREREVAEVRARLRDSACRLLTVLGPGGVGKTRLALQVAADVVDDFEWGVHFVPLAPVATSADIVGAVATVLKFSFTARRDPVAQLVDFIGPKEMLLVLDNFEHVASGTTLVGELLDGAPHVKIIATSRERLRIRAERVYEVEGMSYPSSAVAANWEGFGAVKLFLESARRAEPSFACRDEDFPHVIDICRIVAGFPLAIELATSWLRVLTLPEIAAELRESWDLLETRAADVPARHRSLAAVFDYSYDLLPPEERRAVAALAVFRGSFDRAAAAAVAATDLTTLTALVDKSLVRRLTPGRFELHGLVRQYAEDKLEADPELAARIRRRFVAFYADFLHAREEALAGFGQQEALAEIAAEMDNVRAMWALAAARGEAKDLAAAAEPLFAFYRMRGLFEEGGRVFARALEAIAPLAERVPPAEEPLHLAHVRLLVGKGSFDAQLARYDEAVPLLRRGVAAARRAGADAEVVLALNSLASVAFYRGALARARRLSRAALALARRHGVASEVVPALLNLAFCAKAEEDYASAKDFYGEALEVAQEAGDQNRAGILLNNLANVERALGNLEGAQELLECGLETGREIGNRRLVSFALNNLGNIADVQGRLPEARSYFEASLRIKRELNDRRQMPETLTNLAHVLAALGEFEAALERCEEAAAVARDIGLPAKEAFCQHRKGHVLLERGDREGAAAALAEGFRLAVETRDLGRAAEILISMAHILAAAAETERAVEALAALAEDAPLPAVAGEAAKRLADLRAEVDDRTYEAAVARGQETPWLEWAEALLGGASPN
ncbi:MAG: tetratricopeptide repeat protein [Candidatus Coatesbacteria bacterium]|nr:MAG: tetratricopeptide repeat protein [Candidatus Coatesbacteria bacterium]